MDFVPGRTLRPAVPGEVTRLVVDRNPGAHWWPPDHTMPLNWRDTERQTGRPMRRRILSLSVNDWDHCHFRLRESLRLDLAAHTWRAVEMQRCPCYHVGRPYVQIAYFFQRAARRDWHNWTGKHLLDALVRAGVLADDSDRAVDVDRPLLLVDAARPRVEVWLMYPRQDRDAAGIELLAALDCLRAAYTVGLAP